MPYLWTKPFTSRLFYDYNQTNDLRKEAEMAEYPLFKVRFYISLSENQVAVFSAIGYEKGKYQVSHVDTPIQDYKEVVEIILHENQWYFKFGSGKHEKIGSFLMERVR
jgi:hypothetical protein